MALSVINSPHPVADYISCGFEHHPEGDEVMESPSINAVAAAEEGRLKEPLAEPASFGCRSVRTGGGRTEIRGAQ